MNDIEFKAVPFVADATLPVVKVAVLAKGALRVTFNAPAFAKFGGAAALHVGAASAGAGNWLRLSWGPEEGGWPVITRAPGGRGPRGAKRAGASCTITAHPFKPDVVHQACECVSKWSDDHVVVQMPDWAAIRAEVEDAD
ncbi:MAG TPA: hypothetical protein PLS69_10850 [Terricaulis sp.]|nr:hypothetical protein [Terricaulis sp.]